MGTTSALNYATHQCMGYPCPTCTLVGKWNNGASYPSKPTVSNKPDFEMPDVDFEVMVLGVDSGYPVGVKCINCAAKFEEGDVVLVGHKRLVGWLGWHTRCLKGVLEESPMDDYETIKTKLENGETSFD